MALTVDEANGSRIRVSEKYSDFFCAKTKFGVNCLFFGVNQGVSEHGRSTEGKQFFLRAQGVGRRKSSSAAKQRSRFYWSPRCVCRDLHPVRADGHTPEHSAGGSPGDRSISTKARISIPTEKYKAFSAKYWIKTLSIIAPITNTRLTPRYIDAFFR